VDADPFAIWSDDQEDAIRILVSEMFAVTGNLKAASSPAMECVSAEFHRGGVPTAMMEEAARRYNALNGTMTARVATARDSIIFELRSAARAAAVRQIQQRDALGYGHGD
jgi:hypothetical protein